MRHLFAFIPSSEKVNWHSNKRTRGTKIRYAALSTKRPAAALLLFVGAAIEFIRRSVQRNYESPVCRLFS